MTPVVIESPFKGANKAEEQRNRAYLDKCIRWCVMRNLTPYASHKMLTDALDDGNDAERMDGIAAGLGMAACLSTTGTLRVIFFTDYGMSEGMRKALETYRDRLVPVELIDIGDLGTQEPGDGIEIVDFSEVVRSCRANAEKVFPCEKTKEEFQACGAFPTNCNFDHNWIPCSETPLESARSQACVEAWWRRK